MSVRVNDAGQRPHIRPEGARVNSQGREPLKEWFETETNPNGVTVQTRVDRGMKLPRVYSTSQRLIGDTLIDKSHAAGCDVVGLEFWHIPERARHANAAADEVA
jgi:hypothetical protein